MDSLFTDGVPFWGWWVLGFALLVLEILTPGAFFSVSICSGRGSRCTSAPSTCIFFPRSDERSNLRIQKRCPI